ncbi:hypothetical protein HY484_01510 [Candidatus Woesearchaeota archaeon]|nr:hypothetical protein [Candidatus Woesearchaeota archaeon]
MIDKKLFEQMRNEIEVFDDAREKLIKISRDVLKLSKGAIYSLHRNDLRSAEKQLKDAKSVIAQMNVLIKKDIHLASVGSYGDALEEFVEASCYFEFTTKNHLPSPKELGVDTEIYLPGLCDLVGELVRKAINSVLKDDAKTALKIKDVVEELYAELMMFDFRNSPLRKKFDSIKYSLEKLEDLAVKLKLK